uniref:DIX domain-containing protein n=1 Tax=Oryzias latipes TaxID=8090 RepID=A0A3P9JD85_ORYLA
MFWFRTSIKLPPPPPAPPAVEYTPSTLQTLSVLAFRPRSHTLTCSPHPIKVKVLDQSSRKCGCLTEFSLCFWSLSSPSPLTSLKPCSTSSSQQPECSGGTFKRKRLIAIFGLVVTLSFVSLCAAESSLAVPESEWEKSLSESLEKEVQEARSMVSTLQVGAVWWLYSSFHKHRLVVVRSHLDQSMEEVRELKRELLRCKQEVRNLQAVKDAQQQRLCTQEALILQMKQELLRASMLKEELDKLLQQLKQKLEESRKLQVCCLKVNCYIHVSFDEQLCFLQQTELQKQLEHKEEVQLMQDALRSLRNKFLDHDPQQHTLDTLEQGIVSLMDRLHALHTHRERGKSPRRKDQHTHLDSWPSTKTFKSHNGSTSSTKILYFTGKSMTPSMINIPKRLGEVTLRDVKAAVDREGNYRYHFKALDPEFGTVKEEVFNDAALVPGWEGKIVAWLEEERGEDR